MSQLKLLFLLFLQAKQTQASCACATGTGMYIDCGCGTACGATDNCGTGSACCTATTTGDPHTLGLHGDRFDNKGENNTVYCTFSSRDLHANVLFMYDTFLMGGTCANCMTKVVQGSFMKEIFLVANTAANTTLNIFFSAMSPSLAKYSIPHHRLLPDGELKVSAVLPSKDEFIADNVQVQLERVSARESHLTVKNDEYKIVAKSRMYPWADRNLKRKRLDLTISLVMDEMLIPVAPHGLIGQTFDKDDIAVDGKLDDYTGSKIDGHTSVVVTKAMGEGAIEGVLAEYEINRASPFSTAFKYSRFGLTMADPRNISALSGTKRKIIKVKGIPGSASAVHDITDAMAETSPAA